MEKGEIDPAMCYPPLIVDREMKHGVIRYELNGMVYISSANWAETDASLDKERAEHRASRKAKEYADMAAQFYGGQMS